MADALREASRVIAEAMAASAMQKCRPGESIESTCHGLETDDYAVTIRVIVYLKQPSAAQVA